MFVERKAFIIIALPLGTGTPGIADDADAFGLQAFPLVTFPAFVAGHRHALVDTAVIDAITGNAHLVFRAHFFDLVIALERVLGAERLNALPQRRRHCRRASLIVVARDVLTDLAVSASAVVAFLAVDRTCNRPAWIDRLAVRTVHAFLRRKVA